MERARDGERRNLKIAAYEGDTEQDSVLSMRILSMSGAVDKSGGASCENLFTLEKIGEYETKAIRGRVATVTLKARVQRWLNRQRRRDELDHYL
jgi:hypothetical protein